jgi:hypothetical protein
MPTLPVIQLLGGGVKRIPAQEWRRPIAATLRSGKTLSDILENPTNSVETRYILKNSTPRIQFVIGGPFAEPTPSSRRVRPSGPILDEFIGLESASDEQICSFGKRYGPLLAYYESVSWDGDNLVITELCDVWRYFANSLKALLDIAAGLRFPERILRLSTSWDVLGQVPAIFEDVAKRREDAIEDRSGITGAIGLIGLHPELEWYARALFLRSHPGQDRGRAMWVGLVNCLLALGRTRSRLIWEGLATASQPQVVFSEPSLLSYLALKVCLIAASQDGFAVCSYCQRQYMPNRAPKTGQRNYCPSCRNDGVPVRIAQRAILDRKRRRPNEQLKTNRLRERLRS